MHQEKSYCTVNRKKDKYKRRNVSEQIRIQYLDATIKQLEYLMESPTGWTCAAEDVNLKQGEFRLIHLGVAMQLPKGYEAHIVPRSSSFKNYGIIQTNHMGVIDETYAGPNDWWRMPVLAVRDTQIRKNDRICRSVSWSISHKYSL